MDVSLMRLWNNLASRPSGPFSFRFVIQPIVSLVLGIRSGVRDAREGKPAYLFAVFNDKKARQDLIRGGWKDIARIFFLALLLDVAFQWVVFKWIYPVESLIIAFTLAIVPYALIRGPTNRLLRLRAKRSRGRAGAPPGRAA